MLKVKIVRVSHLYLLLCDALSATCSYRYSALNDLEDINFSTVSSLSITLQSTGVLRKYHLATCFWNEKTINFTITTAGPAL
jgi:hypothetical protein